MAHPEATVPASPAERTAVGIAAVAVVTFGIYGFATSSPNTLTYVLSVIFLGLLIRWTRRAPLPDALAIALAIHAIFHLSGGLINVGHDVLYNASIGAFSPALHTHVLQYDHLVHTFGSCVGTLTLWTLLAPRPVTPTARRDVVVLCVLAGLGIGALNEMIEFLATIAHSGAHVGGYDNTGWDLVCNTVGALIAAGLIIRMQRRAAAAAPAATV